MDAQPLLRPPYAPVSVTTTTAALKQVMRFPVPRGGAMELDLSAIGIRSTGVPNFFRRTVRLYNSTTGVTSVVSSSAPVPDDSPGGYAVDVAFVGEDAVISVVGAVGHTVTWGVTLLAKN